MRVVGVHHNLRLSGDTGSDGYNARDNLGDDTMHDDYGREPSWPVALVVGAIAAVVGVVVRVRTAVRCLVRRDADHPSDGPGSTEPTDDRRD